MFNCSELNDQIMDNQKSKSIFRLQYNNNINIYNNKYNYLAHKKQNNNKKNSFILLSYK